MTLQRQNNDNLPQALQPSTEGIPEQIDAFANLEKLAAFYESVAYNASEETRNLITVARDNSNPRLQLTAIKLLHDFRMEALKLSGHIVTARQSAIGPGGEHQSISANLVRKQLNTQPPGPTEIDQSDERNQDNESETEERDVVKGPEPIVDSPPACGDKLPGLSAKPVPGTGDTVQCQGPAGADAEGVANADGGSDGPKQSYGFKREGG